VDDVTLWTTLTEIVEAAKARWGIDSRTVLVPFTRKGCRRRRLGEAHLRPPMIKLRLHRYHRPKVALAATTIMSTLAHEIAHLCKGCYEHGPAHRAKSREVAAWMREMGYPVAPQLS
jgi:hypothetical protein